ncbi:hypothetical protein SAMN05443635_11265 [Roseobacter denitrificans OCh 114]|nr:hypothetical protein SAMN05443635_11265 [Roseobacter denitrificans OCh 114]
MADDIMAFLIVRMKRENAPINTDEAMRRITNFTEPLSGLQIKGMSGVLQGLHHGRGKCAKPQTVAKRTSPNIFLYCHGLYTG